MQISLATLSSLGLALASYCGASPAPSIQTLRERASSPLYPHDVQGPGYQSATVGKVSNLQGVITAIASGKASCYLQTPDSAVDNVNRTSEGVYVYDSNACGSVSVGDNIAIGSASISEYSSASSDLHITEVSKLSNVTRLSSTNKASAVVIGKDRSPPSMYLGIKNPFALPSNTTTLEGGDRKNSLDVATYGTDFWESLEGTLVTINGPTVLGPVTSYNETFILPANVAAPSKNGRGGLTLAADLNATSDDTRWDANPQAIEIVKALDGTSLDASVVVGDVLSNTTGIISYAFGTYTFAPLTAPTVQTRVSGSPQPSPFKSTGQCDYLVVATYNVENLGAPDNRTTTVGQEIGSALTYPDILVLNEIQDNDGSTDDGVVSANQTLSEIVSAIDNVQYNFTDVDPVNDKDGGEPGGNIRQAFLWRNDHVALTEGIPQGDSTTAVDVQNVNGRAQLTLNPGRIAPSSSAWTSSRKAVAAQFRLTNDSSVPSIFVIGAHFTSKGGSTEPWQNPQAPINKGVEQRTQQAQLVRDFAAKIRDIESDARIIVMGDFNEFSGVQPLVTIQSGNSSNPQVLSEVLIKSRVERYTYIFEQNSQQIDHILTTPSIASDATAFVPHINTWTTVAKRTSDHDPIAAKLNVC